MLHRLPISTSDSLAVVKAKADEPEVGGRGAGVGRVLLWRTTFWENGVVLIEN